MKGSIYIGKISRIKLFIHWTFIILIGWIFLMHFRMGHGSQQALGGIAFLLALFVCVTLHELGHALAARRYNFPTRHITLLPIGGVAQMEALPEKPAQELFVALAGPLVNMVIAFLLYIYLFTTGNAPQFTDITHLSHSDFWANLFTANITLAVFNLIPAFPMDGGRVLRALLAFKLDRGKATKIAASLGQVLAIVFIFFAFFGNIWLMFIGIFIYLGAGSEAAYEAEKSALSGLTVKDAMMTRYTILSPDDTLIKAVHHLLEGQDKEFLVGDGDNVAGVLTRKGIIKGMAQHGQQASLTKAMNKQFLMLRPKMDLQETYNTMMANNCTVNPVYENDQLIGVIDKENIMELIMVRDALKTKA